MVSGGSVYVDANVLLVTRRGAVTGGAVCHSTNALAGNPTFPQTLFPGFNGLVMKLAIKRGDPGGSATVFVASNEPATAAGHTGSGKLRRSTDEGVTWSASLDAVDGFCGTQCSYDNPVGVDPNTSGTGLRVFLAGNARGTWSDVMKVSNNAGDATWANVTFTRDDNGLHADAHTIEFG